MFVQRWLKLYNHYGGTNGISEIVVDKIKENQPLLCRLRAPYINHVVIHWFVLFCFLVPFKKQALLKWKLTSPEQDTKQTVNEISLSTDVLSDSEPCKDNLPSESMDASSENKPEGPTTDVTNSISSDPVLKEEEIDKEPKHIEEPFVDDNSKEEIEPISESTVPNVVETDSEKPCPEKASTNQDDIQMTAISPPKSPEPLAVSCDSNDLDSRDAGDDKEQLPGDAKTGSGTDTPSHQGKRKKASTITLPHLIMVL